MTRAARILSSIPQSGPYCSGSSTLVSIQIYDGDEDFRKDLVEAVMKGELVQIAIKRKKDVEI